MINHEGREGTEAESSKPGHGYVRKGDLDSDGCMAYNLVVRI